VLVLIALSNHKRKRSLEGEGVIEFSGGDGLFPRSGSYGLTSNLLISFMVLNSLFYGST
jgi:hypothetical protein